MTDPIQPHWVLDTGALLAYTSAEESMGRFLADLADVGAVAAVPDLCTMEAFARLHHDEFAVLDILLTHPVIRPFPASATTDLPDLPFIGGMAKTAGRLGAGHAAFVAMTSRAGVWASTPDQIRLLLGDDWPIVEI